MVNPNLLQISTVPVQIEINVTRASLESPTAKKLPKMNVTTKKGGYEMRAVPAKLNIDTYAARSSIGLGHKKTGDLIREDGQRGFKIAYQGTARIVDNGNDLARGLSPAEVAAQNERAGYTVETIMDFIPKTGAEFSYEEGVLNINYEVDDSIVDWDNLQASRLIFNPGKVEITVKQHPKVEIKYVGEPIYFPESANPNYDEKV